MNTTKIIDTTSAAAANLIPAFTGLTGNPMIAAAGAIVAPIIQNQISEVSNWILGVLQRKKIITSANITCETIVEKLEHGYRLRNDDFFKVNHNPILDEKESSASKLLEGSLLKTKEEYDSKKIPFISFFTANIFFAPNISANKAFVMLEVLSKLTYRQLCALRIFSKRNVMPIGRWEIGIKNTPALQNYYDIAYEFLSLKDSLLIEQDIPGQGIGISDYRVSAFGRELVITANLNSIPQEDLSQLEYQVNHITSYMT